jgi:hypothetical protein
MRLGIAAAAAVLVVLAMSAGALASSSAGLRQDGTLWTDRGLHVLGGPVEAAGRVLVLVSAENRDVWLEAIDPRSGKVVWKVREGYSETTAGVATVPLVLEGVALALLPTADLGGAAVRLAGIDVSTGKALGTARTHFSWPTVRPNALHRSAAMVSVRPSRRRSGTGRPCWRSRREPARCWRRSRTSSG